MDPRQRFTRLTAPGVGAILLTFSGCDFPTELPKWDTTWVIPVEETSISVASLLPDNVTVTEGGSAFVLSLDPVTFSRSIGEMCGPCSAVNGRVVPKPAFTAELSAEVALPADLVSVDVAGGRVEVALRHDFSFDPLRPSASARGYLVLTAASGSTQLARDSIDGSITALPPGTTVIRSLPLSSATLAGPIVVNVKLYSPAGDPIQVDTDDRLMVTATPAEVRLASATVRVPDVEVEGAESELSLKDVDEDVSARVKGGALRLEMANPFDVSGTIGLRISGPEFQPIVKSIQVSPGSSVQRVEVTGAEFRSILGGSDVRVSLWGSVSSVNGATLVRPTDEIVLDPAFELTVGPKEDF